MKEVDNRYLVRLFKYRRGSDEEVIIYVPFIPALHLDLKEADNYAVEERLGGER